jgi:hypothetical protein
MAKGRQPRIRIFPETKQALDSMLVEIGYEVIGRNKRVGTHADLVDMIVRIVREEKLLMPKTEETMRKYTHAEKIRLFDLRLLIEACKKRISYQTKLENPDQAKIAEDEAMLAEFVAERNAIENGEKVEI